MNSIFSFWFYGYHKWTTGIRCVELGVETYKFCMEYTSQVKSYKHGDGAKLLWLRSTNLGNVDAVCT
jgi:hypothetical protein